MTLTLTPVWARAYKHVQVSTSILQRVLCVYDNTPIGRTFRYVGRTTGTRWIWCNCSSFGAEEGYVAHAGLLIDTFKTYGTCCENTSTTNDARWARDWCLCAREGGREHRVPFENIWPPRCNDDDDAGALSVLRSFMFTSVTKKTFCGPPTLLGTRFLSSRARRDGSMGTSGPHRRVRRYSDIKKYPVWCSNVQHNIYIYVYIGTYNTLPTVIIVVVVYGFLFFFIRIQIHTLEHIVMMRNTIVCKVLVADSSLSKLPPRNTHTLYTRIFYL